jgi:hypothetical protein
LLELSSLYLHSSGKKEVQIKPCGLWGQPWVKATVVGGWGGGGEVGQTMYTHVSKCKNDIVKGEKE